MSERQARPDPVDPPGSIRPWTPLAVGPGGAPVPPAAAVAAAPVGEELSPTSAAEKGQSPQPTHAETSPDVVASSTATPFDPLALGIYRFLEPLVSGRVVAELWPLAAGGAATLARAGALVEAASPVEPRLPWPDGAFDVVVCFPAPERWNDPAQVAPWLDELRRVLAPTGFCVLRLPVGTASGGDEGGLAAPLAERFAPIEVMTEGAFVGVAFMLPGTEEIALGGDLGGLGAGARHKLVFCGRGGEAPWHMDESLILPLDEAHTLLAPRVLPTDDGALRAELAAAQARAEHLTREHDDLHDQLLARMDRDQQNDEALASLRRELVRAVEQITGDQATLEALQNARDQAVARATRAEASLLEVEITLRRRQAEVAALEREVARLRTRAAASKPGRDPA